MVVFPSEEWSQLFQARLNANASYSEAAVAWEGDILLVVLPSDPSGHGSGVHLDLGHGQCRSARLVPDPSGVESEFRFEATRANWSRLMNHEVDPVRAILDGTLRVKGNLGKLMRFTRASKELVETAAGIPTEIAEDRPAVSRP